MVSYEPWEYESHARHAPAQPSCACDCHAGFTPVNAPYGAAHSAARGDTVTSRQPAEHYPGPSDHSAQRYSTFSEQPAQGRTRRFGDSVLVRRGKSIVGCLLAMFLLADVGVNVAHNAGAVVSRIAPLMRDRPFYFDPWAIVHDAEHVFH